MMGRSHVMLGAAGYAGVIELAKRLADTQLPVNPWVLTGGVVAVTAVSRVTLSTIPRDLKSVTLSGDDIAEGGSVGKKARMYVYSGVYDVIHKWLIFFTLAMMMLSAAVIVGLWYPQYIPRSAPEMFVWILVAAGWALFPDIDEPNSTVSRLFGWASMAASRVIRGLAGGHRALTHTWLFAAICWVLAVVAQRLPIMAGIMMTVAMVLSTRMIFPDSLKKLSTIAILGAVAICWFTATGDASLAPLVFAVPAGILLHDMGDYVTNSGIAFAWPSRIKYAAKLFGTNTRTEHWVVRPILIAAMVVTMGITVVSPLVNGEDHLNVGQFFRDTFHTTTEQGR